MDEATKVRLGFAAFELLLFKGLPAMVEMVNTLNRQEKVTLADIDALKGELDAKTYFE